jgi:hypothetical protein
LETNLVYIVSRSTKTVQARIFLLMGVNDSTLLIYLLVC